MESKAIRLGYGEALVKLGEKNDKVVVLDADLSHATMTMHFRKAYPNRFFNMGIAEQNLLGVASGMSATGLIPFASTFAVFGAGRAFEIIRNSVCYGKLNVKIALTHAGVSVGEDGGSHQAIEDIAIMRSLPNMTIVVASDALEAEKAVFAAADMNGPVYLRMSRVPTEIYTNENTPFTIGKANIVKKGSKLCIFATGIMVNEALKAAAKLDSEGVSTTVVNMHTIKPIDKENIIEMAKNHEHLVSVEEHSIIGGLGGAIAEVLITNYPKKLTILGVKDVFGESGSANELLAYHRLTADKIYEDIKLSL